MPGSPDPDHPPEIEDHPGPAGDCIQLPLEDHLDLHTFSPAEIPVAVEAYLEACREAGRLDVRLIHGKGTGFQRSRIRDLLARLPWVAACQDAPPGLGHWGATTVRLHPAEVAEKQTGSVDHGN